MVYIQILLGHLVYMGTVLFHSFIKKDNWFVIK